MRQRNSSNFEQFSNWINGSISIKMATIGFLILILLIPLTLIDEIVGERGHRKQEVVNEISQSWSSEQIVQGPILTIPFRTFSLLKDSNGKDQKVYADEYYYLLPDELSISGQIDHQTRSRGIYEVTVYDSEITLNGYFPIPIIEERNLDAILWDEAFHTVGISDMKGIQDKITFKIDQTDLQIEPGSQIEVVRSGFTARGAKLNPDENRASIPFSIDLNLRGSKELKFTPLGKTTAVNISSKWPDPSFVGEYLPNTHNITSAGFEANWKVLHLNRNYPQHWTNQNPGYQQGIEASAFGVQLFANTDDYQVVTRASKYGLLTIVLTFLVFFLIEIINKKKIHPLQYILVGLGLTLFYILLVALTEHGGFNMAYMIASAAVILIIFTYSLAIFRETRLSIGLLAVLSAVYLFVFVTLQLVDYALLIGSIGLTLILALTMYLTRNVDWFNLGRQSSSLEKSNI